LSVIVASHWCTVPFLLWEWERERERAEWVFYERDAPKLWFARAVVSVKEAFT